VLDSLIFHVVAAHNCSLPDCHSIERALNSQVK